MNVVIRFPEDRVPYSATRQYREKSADIIVLPLVRIGWVAKVEPSCDVADEGEVPPS